MTETQAPALRHAVVVGSGTMGADVTVVLARGGARVTLLDADAARSAAAATRARGLLAEDSRSAASLNTAHQLQDIDWNDVDLVVENIPEVLSQKRALFKQLDALVPPSTLLTSNSSGMPIREIGHGLAGTRRMCSATTGAWMSTPPQPPPSTPRCATAPSPHARCESTWQQAAWD